MRKNQPPYQRLVKHVAADLLQTSRQRAEKAIKAMSRVTGPYNYVRAMDWLADADFDALYKATANFAQALEINRQARVKMRQPSNRS